MTKTNSNSNLIQIRDLKSKTIILQPQEIAIVAKKFNQIQDKNIDAEGDFIPIMECQKEGKPGYKYGEGGTCYEYDPDDESSKKRAHDKAGKQGQAIEISKHANESFKLEDAFPNFHTARISDPNKYDSFATKELDDGILAVLGIKDNKSEIQAYRFDKKKFTAKEARKWLKDHDEKVIEFAEAKDETEKKEEDEAPSTLEKQTDQKPTYEYLYSVYETLLAHPMVWTQVKNDIHLHARGSAGGKLKGKNVKPIIPTEDEQIKESINESPVLMNESSSGKILYPEFPISMDGHKALKWLKKNNIDHIDVEVIPMAEGVFTGSDGVPTLKKFEEFSKDLHWLNGIPITSGHLANQGIMEVMPDTPKMGQLLNIEPRNDRKDAYGMSRLFTDSLTPEYLDGLIKGNPQHGSIEYRATLVNESGQYGDHHYDRIEKSPYYFYNYATAINKGACEPPKCGILLNEAPKNQVLDIVKIINQSICPIKCKLDKLIEERNIIIKKDKPKKSKK